MIDLTEVLLDYLETLPLSMQILKGQLETEDSISLYCLPGSNTIQEFYDGIKDKQYNYEMNIKTKTQTVAENNLSLISEDLSDLQKLESKNNSFTFNKIDIANEPFYIGRDVDGFFIYRLTAQVFVTIGG